MHTEASLTTDLERLGLDRGGLLIVHSGYKSLGPIDGGPAAVVRALCRALGPEGTLLVPAFTTQLTDPYAWPVPPSAEERRRLMDSMPTFDPERTEPHKMGVIPKTLWRTAGAVRSHHPVTSWVALGARAAELTREHPLDDPEGLDGPVGRVYQADGSILLLGVEHDADTTIHLAESLLDMPHLRELPDRYPTLEADGRRGWRPVAKTTKCSDGFVRLQPHVDAAGIARYGQVGDARAQLLRSRALVRVVVELLASEPAALLCDDPECVHCPTSRRVLADWHPAPLELLPA
jgi:aminoglycoside 3-N-acetyltransferase